MASVSKSNGASKTARRKGKAPAKPAEHEAPAEARRRAGIKPPTVNDALDAEEAAETARTKVAYEKGSIPFQDYPKDDEQIARARSLRLESKALASTASDSVRSRIMRIISASGYVNDNTAPGSDTTPERALLRYAAATTKAVGIALLGAGYVQDNEGIDVAFDDGDASVVMCGLSELLEVGPELITSIACADYHAKPTQAGAGQGVQS